jgi:hypothetical protein
LGKVGVYDIKTAPSRYLPEISVKKRRTSGVRLSKVAGRFCDTFLAHLCGKVKMVDLEPSKSTTKDQAGKGPTTTGHHQYQIPASGHPVRSAEHPL